MRPSNTPPQLREEPLTLAHQLLAAVGRPLSLIVLAAALGAILARATRRWSIHWSWGPVGLAVLYLARPALGGAALVALAATLLATRQARRRHRQDLVAGVDLATAARLRRSPVSVLAPLAFDLFRKLGAPRLADTRTQGELVLGRDERRREVRVALFDRNGGGAHALVVGATGSGKTVTQTAMAVAAIEQGSAVVVLDPKGDHSMRERLESAAARAGRRFFEWTPNGCCVYNPYASGSDTEIADKALAGERFTEPHYLRQAQRYLGHAVRALRASGREISLRRIAEHLDPERLEQLARELPEPAATSTFAYLDSLTQRQRIDLGGVRDRLAVLAESDVGPWLDPCTANEARLELPAAVAARAVTYFRLDSDSRPLLAQMLGAAIVADLGTTVAGLQSSMGSSMVVVDEFSAIAAEQVVRLFGRARSAGVSLVLGTQEISDLRLPGRERLLEQVMGNLSLLIAHRQVVPASADLLARVSGCEGAWKVSTHSDGRTTRTRAMRPVLDPARVMSLEPGWAAVILLARDARSRITHVRPAGLSR